MKCNVKLRLYITAEQHQQMQLERHLRSTIDCSNVIGQTETIEAQCTKTND